MNLITVLLVAVALGTDAFSLAVGIGISGIRRKQIYLVSAVVSVFHVVMPLTGVTLGTLLGKAVGDLAGAIGAVVLVAIGLHMVWDSIREGPPVPVARKALATVLPASQVQVFSGFWGLMLLAGSVSLDALTVGFSLGALRANLPLTVLTMGTVAGLMTAGGFFLGRRMGKWFGEKAQMVGGMILIGIGIKMFLR